VDATGLVSCGCACTENEIDLPPAVGDTSSDGIWVGMYSFEFPVLMSVDVTGIVPSGFDGSLWRAASRVCIVISSDNPFSSSRDMFLSATR
jgi:hypothetical protein